MRKVFKPYFVKDGVRRRILGLLFTPLIVILIILLSFVFLQLAGEPPDPQAERFTMVIVMLITLALYPFMLYGIVSLLRGAVILTDDTVIVKRGLTGKKAIPLPSVQALDYEVRSRGGTSYAAGVLTYLKDGRQEVLELPPGFHFLTDLGQELQERLGNRITIHNEHFKTWRRWYGTPSLRKAAKVIVTIFFLGLYLAPPILGWTWASRKYNLFGFNTSSPHGLFAVIGAGITVGWFLLTILFLKTIDSIKNIAKNRGGQQK